MARRVLTDKEVEDLFLDIWWNLAPETYNTLWVEGIEGGLLVSDCVQVYPKLYKKILNRLEDEAFKRGFLLP